MIRHKSTDYKSIKKEKILIICSCLNENIYLQQNVVIVNQFIEELIADYDITILTSRDTLHLIAPNCVKIVTSGINVRTILKVLKEEKIRKIIPIDCNLKMISDLNLLVLLLHCCSVMSIRTQWSISWMSSRSTSSSSAPRHSQRQKNLPQMLTKAARWIPPML